MTACGCAWLRVAVPCPCVVLWSLRDCCAMACHLCVVTRMPASGLARTLRLDGTPLHVPLYVSLVVSPLRCVVRYGNRGLRQVLVREQAEAQRSNGAMHPFAPSNYPAWPAAYDWAVQWVAAMYDDYLWRGETDLIRVRPVLSYACAVLCCAVLCCAVLCCTVLYFPCSVSFDSLPPVCVIRQRYWLQLVRFWDNCLAHVNAQGLWLTSQVLADIRVGVHCSGDACTSGIVTPWIIQRLRWSVHMATSVGNATVAAGWNATAQRMTAAFREQVVVPAAQGIPTHVPDVFNLGAPDGHQGYSQAGQTIAVFAGLLDGLNPQANLNYSFPPPVGVCVCVCVCGCV